MQVPFRLCKLQFRYFFYYNKTPNWECNGKNFLQVNNGDRIYIKLESNVNAMTRRLVNPTVMLAAPVNTKKKHTKKNQ